MKLNENQNYLVKRINQLKKEKNALILVHNYQRPEIYKVADYIGDSLGLSRKASEADEDIIVFCGVDFMAESAKVLSPDKKVLIPVREANCPMAGMVDVEGLRELRKQYPNAAVVSYVNTTAEIKAESDVCCTSSNAVKVVNYLEQDEIIFVPDSNLGNYVSRHTEKKIIPWRGFCYVHNKFSAVQLKKAKELHPDAKVIIHPESRPEVIDLADYVCSTSQMIEYARESEAKEFIIGTEVGMIEMLKIKVPDKTFYAAPPGGTCIQMKKNTLEHVLEALEKEIYEVDVLEETREKAKQAMERMLEASL